MGKIPMKCPACGNRDVNNILVTFKDSKGIIHTTTLAKILWYLEHPKTYCGGFLKIGEVLNYSCSNCQGQDEKRGKGLEMTNVGLRIPSRPYGV